MSRRIGALHNHTEWERGWNWVRGLASTQVFELGDQLVLGAFDWRDWFDAKPTHAFMHGVDAARIEREEIGS